MSSSTDTINQAIDRIGQTLDEAAAQGLDQVLVAVDDINILGALAIISAAQASEMQLLADTLENAGQKHIADLMREMMQNAINLATTSPDASTS